MTEDRPPIDEHRGRPGATRYPRPVRMVAGVLLGAGLVLRLWLIFGLHFLEEDSLITLRYARNLWNGAGLVYNAGERVMGFTSPLWTLITAPIVGVLPIGAARVALTVLCLLLYAGAVATLLKLAPSDFQLGSWGLVVFAGILALEPRLVAESVSGMEMSLFVLLVAAALWAAQRDRLYLAFALASLSFLTRPEGAIFWGILFLYTASKPHRGLRRLPLVESTLPSAAIVLPWLAFATLYYGTPIPRSAASKSMWGSGSFSLGELLLRPSNLDLLWRNATGLHVAKLPAAGRGLLSLATVLAWLLACYIGVRKKRRLFLAAEGFLAALLLFYYLGRGLFFPWYAVTTIVLFALAVAVVSDEAAEWIGDLLRRLAAGKYAKPASKAAVVTASILLTATFAAMIARVLPWQEAREYEDTVLKPTGEYLRDCTPLDAVVMLEPLGYVGFFSERRIMDLAGLVSPEFRPTREKFESGWGARQILQFKPHFVILRTYEIPDNKFFASFDAPMFGDDAQRRELLARYVVSARFESEIWPERSLVVYRRSDVPAYC